MKNRQDQGRSALKWQAKNVVMSSTRHPQRGVQFAHVPEIALSGGRFISRPKFMRLSLSSYRPVCTMISPCKSVSFGLRIHERNAAWKSAFRCRFVSSRNC